MLYLEELYFVRLPPWKWLIFDLGILCSRLTLNFWAPSLGSRVCTAKNTHLDCVGTSLYPLQIAHKAGQPITKPVLKGQRCFAIIYHALSCTSIWRVSRMVGVPSWDSAIVSSSSLILLTSIAISVCFLRLLVSLQYNYISGGNAVLNMHQGYLGHVIRVTKATGGAYIACAVCFTRVSGCTCCVDPEIMLQHRKRATTVYYRR